MKLLIKIIILIIIILGFMHLRKFKKYSLNYEIQQQELDYINGNELYNQLNPLIITFIEEISLVDNVDKYSLYSSMSFNKKHFLYDTPSKYLSHNKEFVLIRAKSQTVIELINPKYKDHFKKIRKDSNTFNQYSLDKKEFDKVKSIDIIIREYNIIVVPRMWLFKIDNSKIEVYSADNIFTYLFGVF